MTFYLVRSLENGAPKPNLRTVSSFASATFVPLSSPSFARKSQKLSESRGISVEKLSVRFVAVGLTALTGAGGNKIEKNGILNASDRNI